MNWGFRKLSAGMLAIGILFSSTIEVTAETKNPSGSDATTATQSSQPANSSQYKTLKAGYTGPEVAALKQRMFELGYYKTNTVNQSYTNNTAEYVRKFEEMNNLPADGIADPEMQTLFFSGNAIRADGTSVVPQNKPIETVTLPITTDDQLTDQNVRNYDLVMAPNEAFVIDRLSRVSSIARIAAATEDNDPNNNLGKTGGYTSQVFFSSTLVKSSNANMSSAEVIEAGTDCGGSIEVYATVKDAEKRSAYLSAFDGTMFASGSRAVIGTVIVRTSSALKASQQKSLEAEIIEALTSSESTAISGELQVGDKEMTQDTQQISGVIAPVESTDAKEELVVSQENIENMPLVSVKEVGFEVNDGWFHYAVILHNNSKDTAIRYPEFRIIQRDKSGSLLGVVTHVLNVMYPEQDVVWASLGGDVTETPTSVEVELIEPDEYNLLSPRELDHPKYLPLEIQGASIKKGKYSTALVGEVYNPNDYNISSAAITVVFRDKAGKLLAGDTGFCDDIKAGAKVAFEINVQSELIEKTFEVYAMPWL